MNSCRAEAKSPLFAVDGELLPELIIRSLSAIMCFHFVPKFRVMILLRSLGTLRMPLGVPTSAKVAAKSETSRCLPERRPLR